MTTQMNLVIPDRILAQSLLADWMERPGISVTILRGRISPEDARFDLEIQGSVESIARILREGRAWDRHQPLMEALA